MQVQASPESIVHPYPSPLLNERVEIRPPSFPTDVHFVFGYHATPKDFPDSLNQTMRSGDVMLFEQLGYEPELERALQSLADTSSQDMSFVTTIQEQVMTADSRNGWIVARQIGFAAGSGLRVAYIDMPRGELLEPQTTHVINNSTRELELKVANSRSIDQMLGRVAAHLQKIFPTFVTRDAFIATSIYDRISEIFPIHTGVVKANVLIGADHSLLVETLKQAIKTQGLEDTHTVSFELVEPNLPKSYLSEALQALHQDKELSRALLIKYLLSLFVSVNTGPVLSSADLYHCMRADLDSKSEAELQKIVASNL